MSVARKKPKVPVGKPAIEIDEHIVEILSDSGEGAQKCGQSFGAIAARLGYGGIPNLEMEYPRQHCILCWCRHQLYLQPSSRLPTEAGRGLYQ